MTPETSQSDAVQAAASAPKSMDEIVALCRRRGFIFQSSEIYGGINGFWDYGPLGTLLKRNLKQAWWEDMVERELVGPDGNAIDMVSVESTIIMHPKVWEASGHVGGFNDPMVDCKETKNRYRADHAWVVGFRSFKSIVENAEKRRQMEEALISGQGIDESLREFFSEFPRTQLPDGLFAVVADSAEKAVAEAIKLTTKRQRKDWELDRILAPIIADGDFRDPNVRWIAHQAILPFNQLELPAEWPRLSPANQLPTLTEPRQFNLMFETYVGAVRDEENKSYLRPETAQGIFTNFWNIVDTSRVKVPFGIAQQGKAFRNEVTPRNFTFRSREFEQMEIEFFIHPSHANEWYAFWRDTRYQWWQSVGLTSSNLQLREHEKDELAHYAKEGAGTSDIEYRFPFTAPGFGELEGVAHRADYDLKAHATACGKGDKMKYFDQELQVRMQNEGASKDEINEKSRYFPHVIEPSAGADRGTLALLCEAFTPTPDRPGSKFIMSFHPRMAPIKAAVFPLVAKDGMPEIAEGLYKKLRKRWMIDFDVKQSIGKRYARMDEAGTPFCITIDGETAGSNTVTIRHRDSLQQERVAIDSVERFLEERIGT